REAARRDRTCARQRATTRARRRAHRQSRRGVDHVRARHALARARGARCHRRRRHARGSGRSARRRSASPRRRAGCVVTWRQAIALARRSVGRRGGRALLTVLAVALGAALLSSLLIASQAAQRRVLDQVSSGGPLAGIKVDAAAPNPVALDSDNPRPGTPKHIDDAALHAIEALPNVRSVLPVVATPILIVSPPSYPAAAHARVRDDERIFDTVVG